MKHGRNIRFIALTLGDCTGIGPKVGFSALKRFLKLELNDVFVRVFAPIKIYERYEDSYLTRALSQKRWVIDEQGEARTQALKPGLPSKGSGARAILDLDQAIASCLSRECQALVTGPVDKFWCHQARSDFRGHTEYLERKTNSKSSVMLMEGNLFRVALVTTHLALKDVSRSIKPDRLKTAIALVANYLKQIFETRPIAVLGLNPHASDQGLFGSEDLKIILPVVKKFQKAGLKIQGPLSADTAFLEAKRFGAFVSMYHDQGLAPFKLAHGFRGVNITLGLPFLRTSVDHGPAFDLVRSNQKPNSESFFRALCRAAEK